MLDIKTAMVLRNKRSIENVLKVQFNRNDSMVELQTDLGYTSHLDVDITLPLNQTCLEGIVEIMNNILPVPAANVAGYEFEIESFKELLKTTVEVTENVVCDETTVVSLPGGLGHPILKIESTVNRLCPYRQRLQHYCLSDIEVKLTPEFEKAGYFLIGGRDKFNLDSHFEIVHESETETEPHELNQKVVDFYDGLIVELKTLKHIGSDIQSSKLFQLIKLK